MKNMYIIGNWKMNKTIKATEQFFESFLNVFAEKSAGNGKEDEYGI